jgi:hypothetical protein
MWSDARACPAEELDGDANVDGNNSKQDAALRPVMLLQHLFASPHALAQLNENQVRARLSSAATQKIQKPRRAEGAALRELPCAGVRACVPERLARRGA